MRIKKVTLYTHLLEEMKKFYVDMLGFSLITLTNNSFEIKIGESILMFQKSEDKEEPFYHFAFNIPANQFHLAKEWAKQKVTLNIEEGEDEVYFQNINAHSFYFSDPAHNIVECIARHSISPKDKNTFSTKSFLNISEISFTTKDAQSTGKRLIDLGIPVRDNKKLNDSFNFLGKDGCYVLVGKEKRRWFFSNKYAEIHPIFIEFEDRKIIAIDKAGNFSVFHK